MKETIAVDFNFCLADNITGICTEFDGKILPADFSQWDPPLGDKVGLSDEEFVRRAFNAPDLQRKAPPFPGAAQALKWLKKQGHKIVIMTSTCMPPSWVIEWLDRHGIPFDEIVLTKDKINQDYDKIIDDSPELAWRMLALGREDEFIIYDILWNRGIPGKRLFGWSDIHKFIN